MNLPPRQLRNARPHRLWRAALPLLASTLLLGACALTPSTTPPAAQFDLGPPRSPSAHAPAPLHLNGVHAPVWLESRGISYRLGFQDPYRREQYRDSRWVATPAALLAARLREALADSTLLPAAAPGLTVELEEFAQVLDAPDRSHVVIRARVLLASGAARATDDPSALTVEVSHHFTVERAAPSTDARGAVNALAAASDDLIDQILAWSQGSATR